MLDRGSVRHRGPTLSGNYLSEVRLQSLSGATVMDLEEPTQEPATDPVITGVVVVAEAPVEAPAEVPGLSLATAFLAKHFAPAIDAQSCTVMLTTDQLFDRIERHSPGEIPKHILVLALRETGYTELYIGHEFKWLMRVATAA